MLIVKYKNNIKILNRYVDNLLLIWSGTDRQLDKLLSDINCKINEDIKFTIEKGNKQVNYLFRFRNKNK